MQNRNERGMNARQAEQAENKKGMNVDSVLQRPMNPNDMSRESCKRSGAENMKDDNIKPEA